MRHCPNPSCPFFAKFKTAAEYREGVETCSDCGAALIDGASPGVTSRAGSAGDASSKAPRHAVPVSRVLYTLLGPITVIALAWIPLPGISAEFREMVSEGGQQLGSGARSAMTLGAIGLTPFFAAFAIVELFAALVPAWRPLRTSGPAARARLAFPIAVVGTLLASLQAFASARYLASIGRSYSSFGWYGQEMPALTDAGLGTTAVLVASLVGATVILVFVCGLITSRGLGNGYAVVSLCSGLLVAAPSLERMWRMIEAEAISFGGLLMGVVVIGALAVGAFVLGSDALSARLRVSPMRVPLAGLDPVIAAASILVPLGMVAGTALAEGFVGLVAMFVVLVVCTVVGGLLFNRPSRVADVLTRTSGAAARASDAMNVVRDTLPRAVVLSVVVGAAVLYSSTIAQWLGLPILVSGVAIVITAACARDLFAEWTAWRTHGALVSVWPLHQVYAADPVVASLAAEKIPVFLRGSALRSLSPFFGSWVPIEVMVPAEHAERAFAHLDARLNELKSAPAAQPGTATAPQAPAA